MIEATAGLNRVADRLDGGLSNADRQLGRVEMRMNAIRMDLGAIHDGANRSWPSIQTRRGFAEAERLLDELLPAFEEVGAVAVSLQSQATLLRTAVDVVEQVHGSPAATARARSRRED